MCRDKTIHIIFMQNSGNNSIPKPPAFENLKGSTVTARAYLMGANLIDAGGL